MKSEKFGHATTFLAVALAASVGYSGQLAFFPFTDGSDGTEASTVSDTSGTYTGTAQATNANGQKPKFSSDSPGQVCTSDGTVICADPKSLDFRYKDRNSRQGGYVDIPGLADELAGRESFTVEYFIKMQEDYSYKGSGNYDFISKTAFYLKSDTSAFKQIAPARTDSSGNALGLNLQAYAAGGVSGGTVNWMVNNNPPNIRDGKWHHVAIVYSRTNDTSRVGSLSFYCDHSYVGAVSYCNSEQGSDRKFRIGTGYKDVANNNNDKTTTEPINASMSCLRVSGEALPVSGHMYVDNTIDISSMDTAAFYDFKDGASGDAVSTVANSIDSALFQGTGSKTGDGSIVFSDERPAAKILASSSADDVLVENPQSVRFIGGRGGNGGKLALDSLATSLMRLDSYTVEFFFKMEAYDTYRTMAAWRFGDRVSVKFNMTGTAGSYPGTPGTYTACALEALTNTTDGALTGYSYTMRGALGDSWHHLAAVYTRSDNSLWFFIDKKLVGGSVAVTNQFTRTQYPLVLGTSAFSFKENQEFFGGYVSCLRVTPRALTADAFMTTSDKAVPSNTVFALDFNSGVTGTQMVANKTGEPAIETYPYGIKPNIVYNLFQECTPWYQQSSLSERFVYWGRTRMWQTDECLYFPAGSNAPVSEITKWYGAILTIPALQSYTARKMMNPSSWTAEIYAKLERTGLPNSHVKQGLIFGKAGNDTANAGNSGWPRYSWLLTYTEDSKLRVYWTERPSPDFDKWPENVSDTTYYKSATTEQAYMGDLKWHHLALSYDSDAKQFKLYVDKKLALTQSLLNSGEQNALHDGNYVYCVGRSPTTGGFEGWMDEFRFTSKVLQPEEFEYVRTSGLAIFVR